MLRHTILQAMSTATRMGRDWGPIGRIRKLRLLPRVVEIETDLPEAKFTPLALDRPSDEAH